MSIQYLGQMVDANTEFETVIGLEVHVQLATDSKIFSPAKSRMLPGDSVSEEAVNANTTEIDAGHPGTLPSLNKKALEYAIRAGLATNCRINTTSIFSRKHYFYADSPKGYQISQLELPVCEHGGLDVELGEGGMVTKKIGITRIHMEEDAGKSVHGAGFSLINLNRAGTPLIEVVSEPDMRTPEEAGAYLRKLYAIVTAIGVCDGNLQEGNFRCDANVSIRPKGVAQFGTRTETKNVNSFRFVEKAIEYEVERQRQVILSGGKVIQETRLFDSQKNQTFSMRTKEEAEDYRYFPDPDLPPLKIEQSQIDAIRASLPELPDQMRDRFMNDFGLTKYDAGLITLEKTLATFFEKAVSGAEGKSIGKTVANLLLGHATFLMKKENRGISETPFKPEYFTELASKLNQKKISNLGAKQILDIWYAEGEAGRAEVEEIFKSEDVVVDFSELERIISEVVQENPKQAEEFRSGKEKIIGFFIGNVKKRMKFNDSEKLQELIIKEIRSKSS